MKRIWTHHPALAGEIWLGDSGSFGCGCFAVLLLPLNLSVQIYRALLENAASEQGARMSAMDSATRNAGEMIDGLTLQYIRSRQAQITKELIEIISAAEAL